MTIRLVSLDMAGTTIDEGGVVYDVLASSVANAVGRPVPSEMLAAWTGTDKREAIIGLLTDLGADPGRADEVFAAFSGRLDDAYAATPAQLFPGVRKAVRRLRKRGVKVALQTGYTRAVAEPLLVAAGWRIGEDIDALVTADDVTASRPAPYLVFRTMEATGVRSVAEVLVAGDTANDLGAGVNAGARYVVGVLTGAADAARLGRHPHTHLLPGVADIPALLQDADEFSDEG
ncbi:phosphonatase-like hydrolase [Planctomonas sp. JC2975]|uniref:phosphonatase-like hydrolase n=1 Tax=Planctomonas sp. JC2975 TaxID=2729626 RepID=UPI001472B697|nr:phosphonatase-like hydrolase [Planctomonas sp. JC2975]